MRRFPRLATAVVLFAAMGHAWAAAIVDKVQIEGLDDELMVENINTALSLNDSLGKRLGESRLEYLLGEAVAETRERWSRSAITRPPSPSTHRAPRAPGTSG